MKISEQLKDPVFLKSVLGNYGGAFSIGITNNPQHAGLVIRLRVEGDDASGFPTTVKIDGVDIPLVVSTGFTPPKPLETPQ